MGEARESGWRRLESWAICFGVLAGLCLIVAVLSDITDVRVSAGDVSYSCGSLLSPDQPGVGQVVGGSCADALDGRREWTYGVGAVAAVLALIGLILFIAAVVRSMPGPGDSVSEETSARA